MSEYLTVNEAAQFAEVNPRTVYRWIAEGLLQEFRPKRGRGKRVERAELERLANDVVPVERDSARR